MTIGRYTAKLSVGQRLFTPPVLTTFKQNTAAESDEEDDLVQLQTVETKLLAYDPTFTLHHTHAAITTQRSALISAFRPQYEEGDVEGLHRPSFRRINRKLTRTTFQGIREFI